MQLSFDPVVCGLAGLAFMLALHEYRRNTRVILKIVDAHLSYFSYSTLTFAICNKGRPLHDIQLHLQFRPPDGHGTVTFPLRLKSDKSPQHVFPSGMVATFALRSNELDQASRNRLLQLEDVAAQGAVLSFSSDGYYAKRFRIGGYRDKITIIWGRLARRVNDLFISQIQRPGKPTLTVSRKIVPFAKPLSIPVTMFVGSLKKQESDVAESTKHITVTPIQDDLP